MRGPGSCETAHDEDETADHLSSGEAQAGLVLDRPAGMFPAGRAAATQADVRCMGAQAASLAR